ncbi:MAG TPA: 3-deoxy-8-phosphooctulonate synthase [Thermodesulfobacteriota bacterium]|nr:3-deoxy-8-phosphooctulonate synthase [Thermodesulfobacteriota bacterium]
MKQIKLKNLTIGPESPLLFIMGPCVIEDESSTLNILERLLRITTELKARFVFKASYDKANRTSVKSYRGPGLKEGLKVLRKAKDAFGVPVLTDVHCVHDVRAVAEVADIIQIPAFLCRQTDLIVEAASTGRVVNIKKGQFLSPTDIFQSVGKALSAGNDNIIITERGSSFGYNNLVVDFRALPEMRAMGYPVVFDATHSVQTPGGQGSCSGGDRKMARYLARAAVAVGVDGVFMEVHPEPEKALCDGPNSIELDSVSDIIKELLALDGLVRR